MGTPIADRPDIHRQIAVPSAAERAKLLLAGAKADPDGTISAVRADFGNPEGVCGAGFGDGGNGHVGIGPFELMEQFYPTLHDAPFRSELSGSLGWVLWLCRTFIAFARQIWT